MDRTVSKEESPTKKVKDGVLDADAAFAAKLQAEEDQRIRSTRGANSRKSAPIKKKSPRKRKTAARIQGSDESEKADSSVEKKVKNNGFNVRLAIHGAKRSLTIWQKPMNLSPQLSALLGGEVLVSLALFLHFYN